MSNNRDFNNLPNAMAMPNEVNEPGEIITLILQKKRYEVDKQRLIKKSQYFAALLSGKYLENNESEHVINYEIPVTPFENFIKWTHDQRIKDILNGNQSVDCVLTLLELSVLFIMDELTDDIIEKIEQFYLLPDCLIQIWLFAQELGLALLENVCLAACLDRFAELPPESIYELSKDNFMKLMTNNNIRCEKYYFEHMIYEWKKNNLREEKLPNDMKQYSKLSCGIVSGENLQVTSEMYLHCWDNNNFVQLDAFRLPCEFCCNNTTTKDVIAGMQIVGRGCYLYFIGGEFTIGSGRFNLNIWRYSLITKKWFCCTVMPHVRRHMIAAFVGSKLLLMGGMGRFRLKLKTVDIYDVHTDTWSEGKDMPLNFATIPQYYIYQKKLIVYNRLPFIYLYCPIKDTWATFRFAHVNMFINKVPLLPLSGPACYIDYKKDKITFNSLMKLYLEQRPFFTLANGRYSKIDIFTPVLDIQTPDLMFLCAEAHVSETKTLNIAMCTTTGFAFLLLPTYHFYLYSTAVQEQNKFRSLCSSFPKMLFSMINPADLRT